MESIEIWKDIPGYEGYYQASTFGRIRSVDRLIITVNGRKIKLKGKILSPRNQNRTKYGEVNICQDNIQNSKTVHGLIALTFIGERKQGYVVNHKDCNRQNNHVDNLEYVTYRDNNLHAKANKRWKPTRPHKAGINCASSYLTQKQVDTIRKYAEIGYKFVHIALVMDLPVGIVTNIANKKTYKLC